MRSLMGNRNVLLGLVLGVLGLVYAWSMFESGRADLPHILSALTILIPFVILGTLLRSFWPAAAALVIMVVIDVSLG